MAPHSNPENAGGSRATRGQRFHPLDLFHREGDDRREYRSRTCRTSFRKRCEASSRSLLLSTPE